MNDLRSDQATLLYNLGVFWRERGRYEESQGALLASLQLRRGHAVVKDSPAEHLDVARGYHALADLFRETDEIQQAWSHYIQAGQLWRQYDPDHPHYAWTLNNFSLLLGQIGHPSAEQTLRTALAIRVRALRQLRRAAEAPRVSLVSREENNLPLLIAQSRADLGNLLRDTAPDSSERLYTRVLRRLERMRRHMGKKPRMRRNWSARERAEETAAWQDHMHAVQGLTAYVQHNLAELYVSLAARRQEDEANRRRRLALANELLTSSRQTRFELYGDAHRHYAGSLYGQAQLALEERDSSSAIALLNAAQERWQAFYGTQTHHDVGLAMAGLGAAYDQIGKLELARYYYRSALDIWERDAPTHRRTQRVLLKYAELVRRLGRDEKAESYEERAREIEDRRASILRSLDESQ